MRGEKGIRYLARQSPGKQLHNFEGKEGRKAVIFQLKVRPHVAVFTPRQKIQGCQPQSCFAKTKEPVSSVRDITQLRD